MSAITCSRIGATRTYFSMRRTFNRSAKRAMTARNSGLSALGLRDRVNSCQTGPKSPKGRGYLILPGTISGTGVGVKFLRVQIKISG
ncbi:hypothetical protein [Nisaea sp.]|uniref:hypothetical protein n=1 Tax=Nisaea sp. TaxID=2024842 RepID=UPI003299E43B